MDILNIQRYDSSNEEEDDNEKENERASLKKKRKNDYKYYKKKKKIKINNNCFITILYIFIYTLIAFILIFFILKLRASSSFPFSGKNKNLNLRKIDKENNSKIESTKIFNKSYQSDLIMTENINIIEDIKNIDIPPLYLIKDIIDEQISIKNKTKKKIKLAFNYYNLHANGIGRFIAVTANNLIKTGKYDICFITEKPPSPGEFEYDSRIKRFVSNNNYTIIQNITKNENIDIVMYFQKMWQDFIKG